MLLQIRILRHYGYKLYEMEAWRGRLRGKDIRANRHAPSQIQNLRPQAVIQFTSGGQPPRCGQGVQGGGGSIVLFRVWAHFGIPCCILSILNIHKWGSTSFDRSPHK